MKKKWTEIIREKKMHQQEYADKIIDEVGAGRMLIRVFHNDEDGNKFESDTIKSFFELDKSKKLEIYNR